MWICIEESRDVLPEMGKQARKIGYHRMKAIGNPVSVNGDYSRILVKQIWIRNDWNDPGLFLDSMEPLNT
jgi:hypothetical protein